MRSRNSGQERAAPMITSLTLLGADAAQVVVWQVDLSHQEQDARVSRLCGAWVFSSDRPHLEVIAGGTTAVWCTDAGSEVAHNLTPEVPRLDVDATCLAIQSAQRKLEVTVEERRQGGHASLMPLGLPQLPLRPIPANPDSIPGILGVARWFARLGDLWDQTESLRRSRGWLKELTGEKALPIPLRFESDPEGAPKP